MPSLTSAGWLPLWVSRQPFPLWPLRRLLPSARAPWEGMWPSIPPHYSPGTPHGASLRVCSAPALRGPAVSPRRALERRPPGFSSPKREGKVVTKETQDCGSLTEVQVQIQIPAFAPSPEAEHSLLTVSSFRRRLSSPGGGGGRRCPPSGSAPWDGSSRRFVGWDTSFMEVVGDRLPRRGLGAQASTGSVAVCSEPRIGTPRPPVGKGARPGESGA